MGTIHKAIDDLAKALAKTADPKAEDGDIVCPYCGATFNPDDAESADDKDSDNDGYSTDEEAAETGDNDTEGDRAKALVDRLTAAVHAELAKRIKARK